MMKTKMKILVFAVAIGLLVMAGQAKADIIFTLDGTLAGDTFTDGGPFGSITLADNGNNIDVTASLINGSYTVYVISLNWNIALGGSLLTTGWVASGGNIGTNLIQVSQDNAGYNGRFDIRVVDQSTLNNPLTFTLSNSTKGNLDSSFFNTKDELNQLYAVLRTGNLAPPTESSIYYGAKTSTIVPEPGILILLGLSMVSIAGLRRWWK